MTIPTSPFQLAFLLALLVPGVTFAAARVRLRGPRAADRSVAARILEAIVASTVFDAVYAVVLSTRIAEAMPRPGQYLRDHLAACSALFLLLGVVVPYVAAWAVYGRVPWLGWLARLWERVRPGITRSQEDSDTPTAWDWAARSRTSGWVRVRISEGVWVGGVWDSRSRYSTYPESRDLFIGEQWTVCEDGRFGTKVAETQGVWVAVGDETVVEWMDEAEAVTDGAAG